MIQHESIFDPRVFGLPIEPTVEAFLSPAEGRYGGLYVDIFGGGSWQSEFSLLTGLSSASFGSSAYYLFKKGAGRFHTSLPYSLAALGYETALISSCRRNFLHYDEFYRSIGISERIFTDDLPPPFDIGRFETTNSDALFLEAAVDAHAKRVAGDSVTPISLCLDQLQSRSTRSAAGTVRGSARLCHGELPGCRLRRILRAAGRDRVRLAKAQV